MISKILDNFIINKIPVIVGIPNSLDSLRSLCEGSAPPPCHAVEIRLDLIHPNPTSPDLTRALASCPLPILLTARHPEEGGAGSLNLATRTHLLRHHLASAAAIDIELRSLPDMADLANEAKSQGITIVASFHDFSQTPPATTLADVIRRGQEAGADVVKIATYLRSPHDLARLIDLFGDPRPNLPLAAMGMGPLGKVSRLALSKCGSALTYGFLGSANVEGQWSAHDLRDRLREL